MNILGQCQRINQATGISIQIQSDGGIWIQLCSVYTNGNELTLIKKIIDLNKIESIAEHIPAGSVIALNITGKGVLQKKIEKAEVIDQNSFNKILPNAKSGDFYVQNFISGASSFVSVIRKAEADKWIGQLKELKLEPLMLSLGPFPADHIIPQLNIYEDDLIFNGHIITRNEQKEWVDYKYDEPVSAPFPLKIASEKIDEKLVLAYAAAFQLLLANKLDPVRAEVDYLDSGLQNKLRNIKIKAQIVAILGIFFLLLLVNFGLFSWLNSSNNKLSAKVSRFTQSNTSTADIGNQVKNKQALLDTLGWDGGIDKSALIDQIASLMPEELSLIEVSVNPVDINSGRLQRSLVFFNRRIMITGTSDFIIPVNEWIARVKIRPWVKNIQMDSYTYNSELNTGQFNIRLDY